MNQLIHLREEKARIPVTNELISPAMVDELIDLTEKQLEKSVKGLRHISSIEVDDDQFSNIAFREPETWQLHGLVKEDLKTHEQFHTIATGYEFDHITHQQQPIHACFVYRALFVVMAMKHVPGKDFDWLTYLNYQMHRPKDDSPKQSHFDMRFNAWACLHSMNFERARDGQGRIDYEWVEKGMMGTRAHYENLRNFLKPLRVYLQEEKAYTFDADQMIRI